MWGWAMLRVLVGILLVQSIGIPPQPSAEMGHPGEAGDALRRFEVVSIHAARRADGGGGIKPMAGGVGYTAENIPVKLMISLMYKVPMRQIVGAPEWLTTERYDVQAKADGKYGIDELQAMYRNLLAERFGLKFHLERKEGPVYALLTEPGGVKMTANETPQDFAIPVNFVDGSAVRGRRVPMRYLAWFLGQMLQNDARPVVDETGLTGNWDFDLKFRPQGLSEETLASLPKEMLDRPTIFDAVREQLGLRLVAQRGPVEYLVIEKVERPGEN